jgi:uncharacterized RDD family membrane protein YckC
MSDVNWHHYEIPLVRPRPGEAHPGVAQVTTAPAVPVAARVAPDTRPLAERSERLAAAVLDMCIRLVVVTTAYLLAAGLGQLGATPIARGVVALAALLVLDGVQIVLLSWRGQTLGKALMAVRIADFRDGHNPGFVHAVLLRSMLPRLIAVIPLVGAGFVLIDCMAIFGDERRCWHDLFASTKVVQDK